jgi:hypothetical protein
MTMSLRLIYNAISIHSQGVIRFPNKHLCTKEITKSVNALLSWTLTNKCLVFTSSQNIAKVTKVKPEFLPHGWCYKAWCRMAFQNLNMGSVFSGAK